MDRYEKTEEVFNMLAFTWISDRDILIRTKQILNQLLFSNGRSIKMILSEKPEFSEKYSKTRKYNANLHFYTNEGTVYHYRTPDQLETVRILKKFGIPPDLITGGPVLYDLEERSITTPE
jgi:hypothetical protein